MPEFKFFPETHVAFVSEVGPYDRSVQVGFRRLFEWFASHHVHPVGESMAIFYDDPVKVASQNLRCDLCAPVGPEVSGDGDVRTKEIGGWRVATIVYQGELGADRAYRELYDWLHEQGYHEADAPVEKYLSELGEELRAEIAVPVVKKELLPGKQKLNTKAERPARKTSPKSGGAKTTGGTGRAKTKRTTNK